MIPIVFLNVILLCTALPSEITNKPRSLFQDVIKSIKIRSQISEDSDLGHDNTVFQHFDEYNIESDNRHSLMPADIDFIPRRNDRIELPTLRHRIPKNQQDIIDNNKVTEQPEINDKPHEIVILIDTHKYASKGPSSTNKPKKTASKRRPAAPKDKQKNNKNNTTNTDEDVITDESEIPETSADMQPQMPHRPQNNNMSGQSQIGNRESQMVIKPTVIVNFRGTVTNRDSDIKLEGRTNEDNNSMAAPSVFNINQDVHIEKTYAIVDQNQKTNDQKVYSDKPIAETFDMTNKNTDDENLKSVPSAEEVVKSVSKIVAETKTNINNVGDENTENVVREVISKSDDNRESRLYDDEKFSVAFSVHGSNGKFPFTFQLF